MTVAEKHQAYLKFVDVAKKHQEKGYSIITEMYDDRPQVEKNIMGIICPHCKKGIMFEADMKYPIVCCGETLGE